MRRLREWWNILRARLGLTRMDRALRGVPNEMALSASRRSPDTPEKQASRDKLFRVGTTQGPPLRTPAEERAFREDWNRKAAEWGDRDPVEIR